MKKIVILITRSGNDFADRILQCIHYSIGNHSDEGKQYTFKIKGYEIESFMNSHPELTPDNVLFHARTAHPSASWMDYMAKLEEQGFQFINNISVLKLTSDKWQSYLRFKEIGRMPHTILVTNRNMNLNILDKFGDKFIIKTRISQGNGIYVKLIDKHIDKIDSNIFDRMGSGDLLIQDYLDIKAIYRTFCFGNFVLGAITMDDNPSWKKSVCLNRQQKYINEQEYLTNALIYEITDYALSIQQFFGGQINFIDIFELVTGEFVLSEVNTACNLIIHENKTKVSISSYIAEYLIQQANL